MASQLSNNAVAMPIRHLSSSDSLGRHVATPIAAPVIVNPYTAEAAAADDATVKTYAEMEESVDGIQTVAESWLRQIPDDVYTRPTRERIYEFQLNAANALSQITVMRDSRDVTVFMFNCRAANALYATVLSSYNTLTSNVGPLIDSMIDHFKENPVAECIDSPTPTPKRHKSSDPNPSSQPAQDADDAMDEFVAEAQ